MQVITVLTVLHEGDVLHRHHDGMASWLRALEREYHGRTLSGQLQLSLMSVRVPGEPWSISIDTMLMKLQNYEADDVFVV
jgi:hypothetical protein